MAIPNANYEAMIARQLAIVNSLKKIELTYMYELKLREMYRDYSPMPDIVHKRMNDLNQAIDMAFEAEAT